MEDFLQKKDEKLRILREEKALLEVEECVFAPIIVSRKAGDNTQRRNFD